MAFTAYVVFLDLIQVPRNSLQVGIMVFYLLVCLTLVVSVSKTTAENIE